MTILAATSAWKVWGIIILVWLWAISRVIYYGPMQEPHEKVEMEYKKRGRALGPVRSFVANLWDWTH